MHILYEKNKRGSVSVLFVDKLYQTFDFLFQEINDPILIIDTNFECKKFNRAAKKLLGDYEWIDFTRNMDKGSHKVWLVFLQEVITEKSAFCQLNILFPSQTSLTPINLKGFYNSMLQEIVLHLTLTDKETKSFMTLSENKYKKLFECANQGFVISDESGNILELNSQVETFFSVEKENLIGQNSLILFDLFAESRDEILSFFNKLSINDYAEMICYWYSDNGDRQYFQFQTMYNDDINMYVTVIRDETEKIQLKKQIEHNNSLSVLGQLAASIAHEIRNPMTSLKGFTQLLNHTVTDEGKEYLKVIHDELNRMESILNEFLVLSKPTERSLHFVSISDLLSQIVDFMYPQAIMQNIEIHFEKWEKDSDRILGDAYELKKVFINIIKNAIDGMKDGGVITVNQTLFEDNKVKISIKDKGIGMTQEQIHKVFHPFFTTKKNGTGLGLAHAFQTIEDHDGYIEVESEIGQGTTFHLILPVYRLDSIKENSLHDQSFAKSFR